MGERFEEFPPELGGLNVQELFDASNECRHGRLPLDGGPDCGCWNLRRVPLPVRGTGRAHSAMVRRRAVELYAEGVSSKDVAARVGASQRTVLDWVRASGGSVRRRGRPWPAKAA